jgi:protein-S-isoprenylcysteine O-methyltransferase Ste14
MRTLETKIPPPAVALLVAAAMWGISRVTPMIDVPAVIRMVAGIALAVAGGAIALAGNLTFRRAGTTVNPFKPETASSLVTSGVYRVTRNPMYVGLGLLLLGWAAYLCSIPALLCLPVFVWYINGFQIAPEERALMSLFGAAYTDYQTRVRRWL